MQTITRAVLIVGLLACLVASAVQAMSAKPKPKGPACEIIDGACVSVSCTGECAPIFPDPCACLN
jgi:hypothetical protein